MRRYLLFLSVALLFFCVSCDSQSVIVNNLPEREANEIVVILASKGIPAEKVPVPAATTGGGSTEQLWNITVPPKQITDSLAILNQAGLPRRKGTSLLDLFGTKSLVPSDMQDKIRYQEGLSEQLATTIRKMDGIIDANVQITFPQGEEEEEEEMTASVYIKHRGILDNPNSLTITKIKRLVSSAIPGLTIENVSVVTDRALYADISLEPLQALEDQKDFVSIWGITLTHESANRFRLVFYSFIFLLFLAFCALAWLLWKMWPTIANEGYASLFHPKPYEMKEPEVEEEEGGEQ